MYTRISTKYISTLYIHGFLRYRFTAVEPTMRCSRGRHRQPPAAVSRYIRSLEACACARRAGVRCPPRLLPVQWHTQPCWHGINHHATTYLTTYMAARPSSVLDGSTAHGGANMKKITEYRVPSYGSTCRPAAPGEVEVSCISQSHSCVESARPVAGAVPVRSQSQGQVRTSCSNRPSKRTNRSRLPAAGHRVGLEYGWSTAGVRLEWPWRRRHMRSRRMRVRGARLDLGTEACARGTCMCIWI